MQTLPKDSEAEESGKGGYPNTVFFFHVSDSAACRIDVYVAFSCKFRVFNWTW